MLKRSQHSDHNNELKKYGLQTIADWKNVIDTINDMVTIHDNDFNILYANPAAQQILALPSLTEKTSKCYTYYHGTGCPPEGCPSCETINTGLPSTAEIFEPNLDSHLEIRAIPRINNKDKVIGLIHIVRDISNRKKAEEELINSNMKLRNLSEHQQFVREAERKRIAQDMHDELGQTLAFLKLDISWLLDNVPGSQEMFLKKIQSMSESVDSTIGTIEKIVSELRPGLLHVFGLEAALEWQLENINNRTGIAYNLNFNIKEIELDQEVTLNIFRIFQEALTNIIRHSKATKVMVTLEKDSCTLLMTVKDNGIGIKENQISALKSFGVIGMQERASYLGGELVIKGNHNRGTIISATIPLDEKEI